MNKKSSNQKDQSASNSSRPQDRPKRRLTFGRLLVVLIATVLLVVFMLWLGESDLRKGEQALKDGDYRYALFVADEYLKQRPDNSRALSIRARAMVNMNAPADEILKIFDKIGAATVEETHAWGQAFLMKGLWTQALPLLEETVRLQPTNADALYEISRCRLELGQQKEALESALRMTQLEGDKARGYVLVGTIHSDMGNMAEAVDAMAKVLELEPDAEGLQIPPEDFFLMYGETLLNAGRPEESLEPLKRSVAIVPDSRAETKALGLLFLGNAASQLGRQDDAIRAWEEVLSIAPYDISSREALANAELQRNEPAKALEWLKPMEQATELSSSTAYLLQRAYTGVGDEAAIEKWKEKTAQLRKREQFRASVENLIADNPDGFWARAARTHTYASRGNWEQAEALLPRLLEEAPGEPFIIELAAAVRRRSNLPDIEQIPISQN